MPSAEHRLEIAPIISHGLESAHIGVAGVGPAAGLKLSLEAISPIKSQAPLSAERSIAKIQPLSAESSAAGKIVRSEAQSAGSLKPLASLEKAVAKADEKSASAEKKLDKKEEKEEKEHSKEEKKVKSHSLKIRDFHEKEENEKLPLLELTDRDRDEKEKRPHEKAVKDDLKSSHCVSSQDKLSFVGDDKTGAVFRETKCDAAGNPVVLNYDKDQKLMLKMYTRPDGVKAYEDYDNPAVAGATKDRGQARFDVLTVVTGSTEKLTPPASIDEDQSRHGRVLKSEMLEFPDKHAEFVDHNADGSYRVRSAFNKDMVDTDTLYNSHGRVLAHETIDWAHFAAKTK